MEKPFKVHNVRPIINLLMNPNIKDEDRISFSRAVEMLNEIAFKYQCDFKSRYKKYPCNNCQGCGCTTCGGSGFLTHAGAQAGN